MKMIPVLAIFYILQVRMQMNGSTDGNFSAKHSLRLQLEASYHGNERKEILADGAVLDRS